MDNLIQAAGMTAESIIKPLTPKGGGWRKVGPLPKSATLGYAASAFAYQDQFLVISAVEVAEDKDGINRGPEYHLSMSKNIAGMKARCDSNDAKWILEQFGLDGAEEDNHVPGGFVRNFWRAVADPLVGMECACKADEPAIKENKGDFIWRP
jgi:hypothetical protein